MHLVLGEMTGKYHTVLDSVVVVAGLIVLGVVHLAECLKKG